DLVSSAEVPIRFTVYLWAPGTLSFSDALKWKKFLRLRSTPEWMTIRGIKMFADGGYSARNAAVRTPYVAKYAVRRNSRGKINLSSRRIAAAVRDARDAGLQLAVHANGERAQDSVCTGVLQVADEWDGSVPRPRIEHAGNFVTTKETIARWKAAGITPMPQAVFLYNFGDFFPVYLGDAGTHGRFPLRGLLDDGWDLSASSDLFLGAEERQTNPLFGIWCCLKRETFLGEVIDEEQRLTLDEALRMHTVSAARALGVEHERGSIEPGKVADLVVLAEDPYETAIDRIPDIRVDHVYVDGQLRFSHPDAGALTEA